MVKKKGGSRNFRRVVLITIIIVAMLNVLGNVVLLYGHSSFSKLISGEVSNEASITLTVETAPTGITTTTTTTGTTGVGGGGSGGGGGGGGGVPLKKGFNVVPSEINLLLNSGGKAEKVIEVINTGAASLKINIEVVGDIIDYISSNKGQLILGPVQSEKVRMAIEAPEEPGIYAGEVVFNSGSLIEKVLVLLNVRSGKSLFDVSIIVPEGYKVITLGRDLKTSVSISRVGFPTGNVITISYIIKDFEGNELFRESEKLDFVDEKSFLKEFSTSKLSEGDYVVGIEVIYSEGFDTASASFRVEEPFLGPRYSFPLIIIIVLSTLALIVILWAISRYKKSGKHLKRAR